jgi:hypothetical protein
MASAYRRSIVPWSPLRFMSTTIGRFATTLRATPKRQARSSATGMSPTRRQANRDTSATTSAASSGRSTLRSA